MLVILPHSLFLKHAETHRLSVYIFPCFIGRSLHSRLKVFGSWLRACPGWGKPACNRSACCTWYNQGFRYESYLVGISSNQSQPQNHINKQQHHSFRLSKRLLNTQLSSITLQNEHGTANYLQGVPLPPRLRLVHPRRIPRRQPIHPPPHDGRPSHQRPGPGPPPPPRAS